jgi:hypothetical protein
LNFKKNSQIQTFDNKFVYSWYNYLLRSNVCILQQRYQRKNSAAGIFGQSDTYAASLTNYPVVLCFVHEIAVW